MAQLQVTTKTNHFVIKGIFSNRADSETKIAVAESWAASKGDGTYVDGNTEAVPGPSSDVLCRIKVYPVVSTLADIDDIFEDLGPFLKNMPLETSCDINIDIRSITKES